MSIESSANQPTRVLVVDDDRFMRELVQTILEGAGCKVSLAADGRSAIDACRRSLPDLVVTDIFMPEEDGLRVIQVLRGMAPKLPIVAMSSGSNLVRGDYLSIARSLGAAAVLDKPFRPEALVEAVQKALGRGDGEPVRAASATRTSQEQS